MKSLNTLVPAINYLNEFYNSNAELILKAFKDLEGEKVFTVNGEPTKKHKAIITGLKERISSTEKEGHLSRYCWFDIGQNNLYIKFKICLNGKVDGRSFCHYLEKSLYIGKMDNGTRFTELNPNKFEPLKKVTIEEQIKKINNFHYTEKLLRDARAEVNEHLKGLIRKKTKNMKKVLLIIGIVLVGCAKHKFENKIQGVWKMESARFAHMNHWEYTPPEVVIITKDSLLNVWNTSYIVTGETIIFNNQVTKIDVRKNTMLWVSETNDSLRLVRN